MRKKMSEETLAKLRANIAKAREAKMAKKRLQEDIARDAEVRTCGIPDAIDDFGGGQVPAETPDKVEDPAFPEAEDVPHINTPPEPSEDDLSGGVESGHAVADNTGGASPRSTILTPGTERLGPLQGTPRQLAEPVEHSVERDEASSGSSAPPAQSSIGIVGWKTGWDKVKNKP